MKNGEEGLSVIRKVGSKETFSSRWSLSSPRYPPRRFPKAVSKAVSHPPQPQSSRETVALSPTYQTGPVPYGTGINHVEGTIKVPVLAGRGGAGVAIWVGIDGNTRPTSTIRDLVLLCILYLRKPTHLPWFERSDNVAVLMRNEHVATVAAAHTGGTAGTDEEMVTVQVGTFMRNGAANGAASAARGRMQRHPEDDT
ncbi:hypothetical protein E4U53_004060 [Claviceps sorghi]|nr:hypothetical protein E4U53_004060 [Claviceps sorghi]